MRKLSNGHLIGQEIDWEAEWIDVELCVELPFWLMVENTTVPVEVQDCLFPVSVHGETFELHTRATTDSRPLVVYRGPIKDIDERDKIVRRTLRNGSRANALWRKCKTCLRIATRCNEDAWNKALSDEEYDRRVARFYFEELCKAHIPVVNALIQGYRLATYDQFAFEVAPWDVPLWYVGREGTSINCILVPYRAWDVPPLELDDLGRPVGLTRFIASEQFRHNFTTNGTPGEFELLDALHSIERGDYSGAVRRVATAIEAIVEAVLEQALVSTVGDVEAEKFIRDTRKNFRRRVSKIQALIGRTLPIAYRNALEEMLALRDEIVHRGYRLAFADRGRASMAVDKGRWIFNWLENDPTRRDVRERHIARRSLGRDLFQGALSARITPDGMVLTPPVWLPAKRPRPL